MAFMMNADAMVNSCKIILEIFFFQKSLLKFKCAQYLYVHYTRYNMVAYATTTVGDKEKGFSGIGTWLASRPQYSSSSSKSGPQTSVG
jgi:hypothetical protein